MSEEWYDIGSWFGGDTDVSSDNYGPVASGQEYGDYLDDGLANESTIDWNTTPTTTNPTAKNDPGLWDQTKEAMATPQFLAGLLTTGAGYLTGKQKLEAEAKQSERQQQSEALKNMIELAKLKYSLGQGAGGGGGGSGRNSTAELVSTMNSVKTGNSNALQVLGANVSGAYGRR